MPTDQLTDKDAPFTLAEVAKRWDCHKETVRPAAKLGLRGIKFGRRLMFRLADVRAFENQHFDPKK